MNYPIVIKGRGTQILIFVLHFRIYWYEKRSSLVADANIFACLDKIIKYISNI